MPELRASAIMERVDAAELFGTEQVERAHPYHRPLYAAARVEIGLQIAVPALIAFGHVGGWPFEPLGLAGRRRMLEPSP